MGVEIIFPAKNKYTNTKLEVGVPGTILTINNFW